MAEVGAHLVRDVFVAADEMHDNAMSSMDGNSEMEVVRGADDGAAEAWDSPTPPTDATEHAADSTDDASDGENPVAAPIAPLRD